jgi:hypothetical protein
MGGSSSMWPGDVVFFAHEPARKMTVLKVALGTGEAEVCWWYGLDTLVRITVPANSLKKVPPQAENG